MCEMMKHSAAIGQRRSSVSLRTLCCTASLAILANIPAMADSISFSQTNYSFNEVQGTVPLQVEFISDYGGACDFTVPVRNFFDTGNGIIMGSATSGVDQDYTLDTTVLTFSVNGAGAYSAIVNLTLNDDAVAEPMEDIILSFGPTELIVNSDCSVPPFYDIPVSPTNVAIYDSYTQQAALSLEGPPGETVFATFDINTASVPLGISSLQEFDGTAPGPAVISPKTVTQAAQTVITYSYTIPEDAIVGQSFVDTITIEPIMLVGPTGVVGDAPQEIDIPVTINTVMPETTGSSHSRLDRAWQSLCSNNQENVKLSAQCAKTPGLLLDEKQQRDLSPEEMVAMANGSASMMNSQMKNVFYQQRARRSGVTGVDLNHLSFMLAGQEVPLGRLMGHYLEQQAAASDAGIGSRWSAFATGRIFNSGKKEASAFGSGYDFDTYGLTLGADYQLSDQLFLGGAVGYSQMKSSFGNDGGDMDVNANTFIVYGGYFTANNLYIDGSAFYTLSDYDFTRKINSFATQVNGDAGGDQYAISLSMGMDFNANKLLMAPYGRLEYIRNGIDAYTESGGGGLALDVESQDVISRTSTLGGRFSYAASMRWGVLVPTAHAEWVHEYSNSSRDIVARFAQDPNGLTFATPVGAPDSNYFNWGLGLSATLPAGRSLFISYERVTAKDLMQYTIYVGGRMEFN